MINSAQRIVCLGWGSLIWDPRELRCKDDPPVWNEDGPQIPIEYARQSSGDRITLVIVDHGSAVPVLWTEMSHHTVAAAAANLEQREGTGPIGVRSRGDDTGALMHSAAIAEWAQSRGIDAVIWTAIAPKFDRLAGKIPSEKEVLEYLLGLIRANRHHAAERYIRRTPPQIRTPYRSAIERTLGWSYSPNSP